MQTESRRQKKVGSVVKEELSDIILNQLNDPRIEGLISVTRVEMTPDLKKADVYISVFGVDQKTQKQTFAVITQAKRHIQTMLAGQLNSRTCPSLNLIWDEQIKKTLEIIDLIDKFLPDLDEEEPDIEDID